MHGLRHHPVAGCHDDPVGGQQAQQHRTCQADEREHPGVVQHEVLRGGVDDGRPWSGQHGHEDDDGGDQDGRSSACGRQPLPVSPNAHPDDRVNGRRSLARVTSSGS